MSYSHSHDGGLAHSHAHDSAAVDHGHTHEILDSPGSYLAREMPIIHGRNWAGRSFTVGIGGYVLLSMANDLIGCVESPSRM
jgi:urease accessory protein